MIGTIIIITLLIIVIMGPIIRLGVSIYIFCKTGNELLKNQEKYTDTFYERLVIEREFWQKVKKKKK